MLPRTPQSLHDGLRRLPVERDLELRGRRQTREELTERPPLDHRDAIGHDVPTDDALEDATYVADVVETVFPRLDATGVAAQPRPSHE